MRGVRVFLMVFGLCAVAAALAAPFVIQKIREIGDSLQQDYARGKQEVEAFAAEHEQKECAAEALRRAEQCDGVWCQVGAPAFMDSCLSKAAPSRDLCDEIPRGFLEVMAWPERRCADAKVQREICKNIYTNLLHFCSARGKLDGSQRPPRHKELHGTPSPSPSS
jgi:hypothetical protein